MSNRRVLDPRKGTIPLIPSMGSSSKPKGRPVSGSSLGPSRVNKNAPISTRTKEELAKKEAEIVLKGELLQQGLSDAPQEVIIVPRLVEVTAEEFVDLPVKEIAEPVGGIELNDPIPEERIRTAPQKSLDLILYEPERIDPPLKKEKEVYIPASWTSHKSSGKVKRKNRNNK